MIIRKHLFPIMVTHTTRLSRDKRTKPYLASCFVICPLLIHPSSDYNFAFLIILQHSQYKQTAKKHLKNLNFLNYYTKVKRKCPK